MSISEQKSQISSPKIFHNLMDSQLSNGSANNNSVWMAKKQRFQVEKHIDILRNRLALLMQEENKAKKKILETKKKTHNIFKLKEMNYNDQLLKGKLKNKFDEENQQKSMDIREQRKENFKNLKEELSRMKKQESLDIRRVAEENTKKLYEIRVLGMQQKKEKVQKVKNEQLNSKRKINYFWEQKRRFYTEQHAIETFENEKSKENLEKELEKLENIEVEFLQRLENTQNLQNKLYDRYEETFLMSSSQIGEIEKQNPKKKSPTQSKKITNNVFIKNEGEEEKGKWKNNNN